MLSGVGLGTAVTSARVGGMATVNEVIERELLGFPAESVTLTVQFECAPSARTSKVIVLLPSTEVLSVLLQSPP